MIISELDVKQFSNIADNTKDLLIAKLIESATDYICTYCNDTFDLGFPKGLRIPALKIVDFYIQGTSSDISSLRVGNETIVYLKELPKEIKELLNPYRKVRFI